MALPVTPLRCSKCGQHNNTDGLAVVAKLGGTHYVKRAHRFDASKRGQPTIRVVSCGTWEAIP